ncbi:MAG TPA: PilZ domain-containing protein [Oscillatoriaceae cyanobacterium]
MALPSFQSVTLEIDGTEHAAQILGSSEQTLCLQVAPGLLPPKMPVLLRFASQQFYYQARLPIASHHECWWFLPRPDEKECERVQRRTFVRIQFNALVVAMPITETGEPNGELTSLTIANLSAEGCYAMAQEAYGAGDRLLIFLSLPDLPTMNLVGTIVRSQLGEEGYGLGIKFEELAREQQEQLAAFINAEIQAGQELGVDIILPG